MLQLQITFGTDFIKSGFLKQECGFMAKRQ